MCEGPIQQIKWKCPEMENKTKASSKRTQIQHLLVARQENGFRAYRSFAANRGLINVC